MCSMYELSTLRLIITLLMRRFSITTSSSDQVLDIFTRSLSTSRFYFLKSKLLVDPLPINLWGHVKPHNSASCINSPTTTSTEDIVQQLQHSLPFVTTPLSSTYHDSNSEDMIHMPNKDQSWHQHSNPTNSRFSIVVYSMYRKLHICQILYSQVWSFLSSLPVQLIYIFEMYWKVLIILIKTIFYKFLSYRIASILGQKQSWEKNLSAIISLRDLSERGE